MAIFINFAATKIVEKWFMKCRDAIFYASAKIY